MDERPLVSVVIPTRNRVDLLSDALGSLVEQDYPADR
jgi:glycosyltransferase involved in cell wall biosynthesis